MEQEEVIPSIHCLPDEVIVMILQNIAVKRDILNFGTTCKHFNNIVRTSNQLWKNIYKQTLPEMVETLQIYGCGDWYKEVKEYFTIKQNIYSGLTHMASLYYERINPVRFADISGYYNPDALFKGQNYYYTVSILQDMIKKTQRILSINRCSLPYRLTEMYYAKTALRCYFHAFLALKWSIWSAQGERPSPLKVVNFFVQWVYNVDLESDDIVDRKISELAAKVEQLLEHNKNNRRIRCATLTDVQRERLSSGRPEEEVLAAISNVLYQQRHVTATDSANYDSLNVVKILENRCGHNIAILAIYQAVALKLGVHCELNVFPNHLFLEWCQDWLDDNCYGYVVDVNTGVLKPKGRCPFSRSAAATRFKYEPENLIECLFMAFQRTMGYIQDWNTQNAQHITELMRMEDEGDSAYYRFLSSLRVSHQMSDLAVQIPLDLKFMSTIHRDLLISLFTMDGHIPPMYREKVLKRHPTEIKYAVGMVCTHTKTEYKCVIKGWDVQPCPPGTMEQLRILRSQSGTEALRMMSEPRPFYYVLAVDQSTRHVPQEYLTVVKEPSRLCHLEDNLATEFTHFDGYRYVPNEAKQREYPDDNAIALMYKSRAI